MARIIVLANQKGGVGKTTLATHFAAILADGSTRVLFVDTDSQGSGTQWVQARVDADLPTPWQTMAMPSPMLHKELPKITADYDYIIIDTPPRTEQILRSALVVADLLVLPLTPGGFDLWALQSMQEFIEGAQITNPRLKAVSLLNCCTKGAVLGEEISGAVKDMPWPLLETRLYHRQAYRQSTATARTVTELHKYSDASIDMTNLLKDILDTIPALEIA